MALITPITMKTPFEAVSAGGITFAFTAGNTGGDTISITGREIIIIQNTGIGARTFTIASEVDEKGRSGPITAYSLAAGEFAYFTGGLTNSLGWRNVSTGLLTITPSHAEVKYAVLKLPAGTPG
jgi:hypothetical protein